MPIKFMEKSKLLLVAGALILVGNCGCIAPTINLIYDLPTRQRIESRENYCGPFTNGRYISGPCHSSGRINARIYGRFER